MNDKLCCRCHQQPRKYSSGYCVECAREYNREWARRKRGAKARPIKPVLNDGEKFCFKCERILSIEHFHRCKSKPDGRMSTCKDCDYLKQLVWRAKNRKHLRERERKSSQRWRDTHPGYNKQYNQKRRRVRLMRKLESLEVQP